MEEGKAPETFAGYELISMLGKGGMGAVFRARQISLDREVALKIMVAKGGDRDATWGSRFVRETRIHTSLIHPHLVRVYDSGVVDDRRYIAMEVVEGMTLHEHLKMRGPVPADFGMLALRALAEALEYLHGKRIIHRDLKPANVMIGEQGLLKVMDFGIARRDTDTMITQDQQLIGTIQYMPPEMIRGDPVGAPMDIYAAGLILYELLSGSPPYKGRELPEWMMLIQSAEPRPLSRVRPGIPVAIDDLILPCLDKDPANRPTAAELAALTADLIAELGFDEKSESRLARLHTPIGDRPTEQTEAITRLKLLARQRREKRAQAAGPLVSKGTPSVTGSPSSSGGLSTGDSSGASTGGSSGDSRLPSTRVQRRMTRGVAAGGLALGTILGALLFSLRDPSSTPVPPAPSGPVEDVPAGRPLGLLDRTLVATGERLHFSARTLEPVRLGLQVQDAAGRWSRSEESAATHWHRLVIDVTSNEPLRAVYLATGAPLMPVPAAEWASRFEPDKMDRDAARALERFRRDAKDPTGISLGKTLRDAPASSLTSFWMPSGTLLLADLLEAGLTGAEESLIALAGRVGDPSLVTSLTRRLEPPSPPMEPAEIQERYSHTPAVVTALTRIGGPIADEAVHRFLEGGFNRWLEVHPGSIGLNGLRLFWQRGLRSFARHRPDEATRIASLLGKTDPSGAAYYRALLPSTPVDRIVPQLASAEMIERLATLRAFYRRPIPLPVYPALAKWSQRGEIIWEERMMGAAVLALSGHPEAEPILVDLATGAASLEGPNQDAVCQVMRLLSLHPGRRVHELMAQHVRGASAPVRRAAARGRAEAAFRALRGPEVAGSFPTVAVLAEWGKDLAGLTEADPTADRLLARAFCGSPGVVEEARERSGRGPAYGAWQASLALAFLGVELPTELPAHLHGDLSPLAAAAQLSPMWKRLRAMFKESRDPATTLHLVDPTQPGCGTGLTVGVGDVLEIEVMGVAMPRDPEAAGEHASRPVEDEDADSLAVYPQDLWLQAAVGDEVLFDSFQSAVGRGASNPNEVVVLVGGPLQLRAGLSRDIGSEEDWVLQTSSLMRHTGTMLVRIHFKHRSGG